MCWRFCLCMDSSVLAILFVHGLQCVGDSACIAIKACCSLRHSIETVEERRRAEIDTLATALQQPMETCISLP